MPAGDSVREHARRWADAWQAAWQALDVEAVVALYTEDAIFSSHPFRPAHRGRSGVREYVSGAFGDEAEVRARFGEPLVDGDSAAVEWWATLTEGGSEITLFGTSVLRFDAEGLVLEQRDTWNQASGRREPLRRWSDLGNT